MYAFFAFMKRMKYVKRWSLMRNSSDENLLEHSHETAMLAHALAVIGNEYFGKAYNPDRIAVLALYHDATEVLTGDLPTPVKYANDELNRAYKRIEAIAGEKELEMIPERMRKYYREPIEGGEEDYLLVKQADKLSAYIKCIEERKSGNGEFRSAEKTIKESLDAMEGDELSFFIENFLPAYELDLDAQNRVL